MSNSMDIGKIRFILNKSKGKVLSDEEVKSLTTELAAEILSEALKRQTSTELAEGKQIAGIIEDKKGKSFSLLLIDQCFRTGNLFRVADQIIFLIKKLGVPDFLTFFKKTNFLIFRYLGKKFAYIFVPVMHYILRKESSSVVIPAEKNKLESHVQKRKKEGVRTNINHLGEAILGESEAKERMALYVSSLEDPNIEYISIKISTIYSQISHIAFDETIFILKERLRTLYRVALSNFFEDYNGNRFQKFINLDMEEYKDLYMTVTLFKEVLDEEEFLTHSAGIVLQAYLPESYGILKELTKWSMQRVYKGGAPIKVRLVKGANLAMEKVESSLKGWSQAPYRSKKEVDSNYKRLLMYGCRKEFCRAVHLGIASHNLFDMCLGMILSFQNELKGQVCFEMLEGMVPHIRKVIQSVVSEVLLYCPVVRKDEFQYAMGYLVRRFDENTGAENFLSKLFSLEVDNVYWREEEEKFLSSFDGRDLVSISSRREQNRFNSPVNLSCNSSFDNESDTDWSLLYNQMWAREIILEWKGRSFEPIPLVIGGRTFSYSEEGSKGCGKDPSYPNKEAYQFTMANLDHVEEALNSSETAFISWNKVSLEDKIEVFRNIAREMRENRKTLIGAMVLDGGKTIEEADVEVSEAIDFVEYYWRSARDIYSYEGIQWHALGTILVIPPWNFPCAIPAGGILAALITGNSIIFKPARETILVAWELVKLFWKAGVPKDVLQFLTGSSGEIGDHLIGDQRVKGVVLTGSTETAKHFLSINPTLNLMAETGGKNALIITSLSDRDLALKDAVESAFGHSGQKCSACSLLILEGEVYDDPSFKEQLRDVVESLHVSESWDLKCKINPLVLTPGPDLSRGLTTLDSDEEWLVEPHQDPDNPHLYSPGVKWGVSEGSYSHQTEFFGPVLSVIRAENLDDAIRIANGTKYGLTSGIHSLDEREQKFWLESIEAGNCYINRGITGAIVRRQPFGGCKESSFGSGAKVGGPNYLIRFMLPKENNPPSNILNQLDKFSEGVETFYKKQSYSELELELWSKSVLHYLHAYSKFSINHDPSQVLGQDNYISYKPIRKVCIRIQEGDKLLDLLRVISACQICNTEYVISYSPSVKLCTGKLEWFIDEPAKIFFNNCNVVLVEEDVDVFVSSLFKSRCYKVRLLSKGSKDMMEVAVHSGVYMEQWPVLSNGFIELLHYLREVSVSNSYHRYGNLGLREGERRKLVL